MSARDRQAIYDALSDSGSNGSPTKSTSSGDSSGYEKISRNLNNDKRSVRFTESSDDGGEGFGAFNEENEYSSTSQEDDGQEEYEANYAAAARFGSMDINKMMGAASIAKRASDVRDMLRTEPRSKTTNTPRKESGLSQRASELQPRDGLSKRRPSALSKKRVDQGDRKPAPKTGDRQQNTHEITVKCPI